MSRVDPTEYVDPAHRVVLLWVSVLVIQGNSNQREALIIFSMVLGSLLFGPGQVGSRLFTGQITSENPGLMKQCYNGNFGDPAPDIYSFCAVY